MKNKFIIFLMTILVSECLFSQIPPNDYIPKDSIFFEHNTIPYHIYPTQGNCWQVGTPSKTDFNQAYSLPWAIVTDTLLPYPINTNSSFYFSFRNHLYGSYFEFLQKYDSDTLTDYGSIEVSYDHGSTWSVLEDTSCQSQCIQLFWSDDVIVSTGVNIPHLLYPSGHSQGWIKSQYTWWWIIPENKPDSFPTDSIYIKFTFKSDSIQTNKDGWMIDNIITGELDFGSGISDMNRNSFVTVSPNPLTTVSVVRCSNDYSNSSFEVYDLTGRLVFCRSIDQNRSLLLNRKDFITGVFLWKVKSKD